MNDNDIVIGGMFGIALLVVALVLYPPLGLIYLIVFALMARAANKPPRPYWKPPTLAEAYRAVGQEPPLLRPAPSPARVLRASLIIVAVLIAIWAIEAIGVMHGSAP